MSLGDLHRRLLATRDPARITPRSTTEPAPMSSAQQRMRFLEELDPGTTIRHVRRRLQLRGALDVDALSAAFRDLQARHEILRARFPIRDDVPTLEVTEATIELVQHDLRPLRADERAARIADLSKAHDRPFELEHAPPWRVELVRLEDTEHLLWITLHHIITDNWSMRVLLRELGELYAARIAGRAAELAPLPIQFADYAAWEQARVASPERVRRLAYWRDQLRDVAPIALPSSGGASHASNRGASFQFEISAELAGALRALCAAEDATLFMTLLAAFDLLLARYSGSRDIAVATPVANRLQRDTRNLLGLFVNTIVVRVRVDDVGDFRGLLRGVREAVLDGLAHQDVAYDRVLSAVNADRGHTTAPLFNVMVTQYGEQEPVRLGPLEATTEMALRDDVDVDLTLSLYLRDGGPIVATFVYAVEALAAATVEQMARHFTRLLELVAAAPDAPLAALDLQSPAERAQLAAWNATAEDFTRAPFAVEMFEAQVDRAPDAIALTFEGEALTYRELDARANQLAHQLIAAGAGGDRPIGVCLERSPAMVVAILAILKAGAPYLPIDPTYPPARVRAILADSGCALVVGDAAGRAAFAATLEEAGVRALWLETLDGGTSVRPNIAIDGRAAAYMLFTSGSTGRPKGVVIDHAALRNQVLWPRALGFDASDRFVLKTPFTFDVSVFELINPFTIGARLVISREGGHRDPQYLAALIRAEQATYVHFVPSMLGAFLDVVRTAPCPSLRRVVCSGEALLEPLARAALEVLDVELYNLYGPTEATVHVSVHRCDGDPARASVPIGVPAANTRFYILDHRTQPTPPVGAPGELYLAGVQLARGYASRPDLTAERFVPDPFHPGERMYRTGDLARLLPDGQVEYLGRLDDQVKLRGQRIELAEITAVLRTDAAVVDAAVVVRDERLVAYVVPAATLDAEALAATLRAALPDYMVPTVFVPLAALPLTSSGKLDRKALPAPELISRPAYVAPRTEAERVLAELWGELLRLECVGVHDNFFALGGHSLLAMRLSGAIRRELGVQASVRTIFEAPTLEALARTLVSTRERSGPASPRPAIVPSGRRQGPMLAPQRGSFLLDRFAPSSSLNRLTSSVWLDGELDIGALELALDAMRDRHPILRTRFYEQNGAHWQEVLDAVTAPALYRADLAEQVAEDQERTAASLDEEFTHRPFALGDAEVMRALLVSWSPTRHRLTVSLHHVVSDPTSKQIFMEELFSLWHAYATPRGRAAAPLTPPSVQYLDLVDYLERLDASAVGARNRAFWSARLAGLEPPSVPTDVPRGPLDTLRAEHDGYVAFPVAPVRAHLGAEIAAAVERSARDHNTSVMSVLLAALASELTDVTGQTDLAIISPLLFRHITGLERTIGFFANPLVMRISSAGGPSFPELVQRTHDAVTSAYDHGEFDVLALERRLFRISFNYQYVERARANQSGSASLPGVAVQPAPMDLTAMAHGFDLMFVISAYPDRVNVELRYNLELFTAATATRLLHAYLARVARAVSG